MITKKPSHTLAQLRILCKTIFGLEQVSETVGLSPNSLRGLKSLAEIVLAHSEDREQWEDEKIIETVPLGTPKDRTDEWEARLDASRQAVEEGFADGSPVPSDESEVQS